MFSNMFCIILKGPVCCLVNGAHSTSGSCAIISQRTGHQKCSSVSAQWFVYRNNKVYWYLREGILREASTWP